MYNTCSSGTSMFTSYLSSGFFFSIPTDSGFTGISEAGEALFIHEAVAEHILWNKKCHKTFILYCLPKVKHTYSKNTVSKQKKKGFGLIQFC